MKKHLAEISKFLSFVLRHRPHDIGLVLDKEGWVTVEELLEKSAGRQPGLTRATLEEVVATNDKKRFALSSDGLRIRALQGHSTKMVDIAFKAQVPPVVLYHGTATRFLASIRKKGLLPQTRQYVHLSKDITTATAVGARHGKVVILTVDAKAMLADGFKFYLSDNEVWLTKEVPVKYLTIPK